MEGYKRINYKNLILKEMVIPKVRESIERLGGRAYIDFPRNEPKFPLITFNINDNPSIYDVMLYEVISNITVNAQLLDSEIGKVQDLEYELSNCMVSLGFTRQEPTQPYRKEAYGKFQIDIRYNIRYNALTQNFERAIS